MVLAIVGLNAVCSASEFASYHSKNQVSIANCEAGNVALAALSNSRLLFQLKDCKANSKTISNDHDSIKSVFKIMGRVGLDIVTVGANEFVLANCHYADLSLTITFTN